MRIGQNRLWNRLPVWPCLAAAGMLLGILLLDLVLALFAAERGPMPLDVSFSEPVPAPHCFRTAAERAGNLAAMHDGAGTGVRVQIRGGRSSPASARRLQSDAAHLDPVRVRESVPNRPECLGLAARTFLFQLFPRRFLPVRAGPHPLC